MSKDEGTSIVLEHDGKSVETTLDDIVKVGESMELPGMPAIIEPMEVTITGKDGWFDFPQDHDDIRVGLSVDVHVIAHVSQVGIRESTKEGEHDVRFIKLKAEIIDTADPSGSWRAYPKDVRDE